MTSLAEQISKLTNPTPIFADPEDVDDGTGAKLLDKANADDDVTSSVRSSSKLRRQVAPLLVEEDSRYAGKRTSRSNLLDQDQDMPGDDEGSEDEEQSTKSDDVTKSEDDDVIQTSSSQSDSGEEGEQQLADFREKLKLHKQQQQKTQKMHLSDESDQEELEDASEDEDEDDDDDDEAETDDGDSFEEEAEEGEDEEDEEEEVEGGVQSFSTASIDGEIQKGKAARAQLNLWDNLLEARIKLQKVLGTVNQLPQPDTWQLFAEASGKDQYLEAVKAGQTGLQKVLEQLVKLQTALLLQNPETKHVVTGATKKKQTSKKTGNADDDDDDEEITSESDMDSDENDAAEQQKHQLKRKLRMVEYPEFLAKRHKDFQQYRNTTIQKWFDKTRVASGKLTKGFTAFEQSAMKQIEQILSDKDRLIKRTQLKRSTYRTLGKDETKQPLGEHQSGEEEGEENKEGRLPARDHLKDYDGELFDDDDFYHQLLRELIERKTSDLSDPVALSRQWLEVQKLRNKIKKKVDTKASKGRKIRYEIHPKLVNFMAPEDRSRWTDEQRDELYSSLFGKRHCEPAGEKNATGTTPTAER